MSQIEALFSLPWDELQAEAWRTRRRHHPDGIAMAVPGTKRYETEHYRNTPYRFASLSVTGQSCALGCEHCRGQMLEGMIPARTPEEMLTAGRRLVWQGCHGVLVSGGAGLDGAVPLNPLLPSISRLKAMGLQVIVHTGLLDQATAEGLADAGVDQVLFDVVGDTATIQQVLHLDRTPADYAEALAMLRRAGLRAAPHIVMGLHYGELRGELEALRIILDSDPEIIVIVVVRPVPGTPMAASQPVAPEPVGRLAAVARILNPTVPVTLGCARPAGPDKPEIERRVLLAGVNAIAYPDPATVDLAKEAGLSIRFEESCCTLTVGAQPRGLTASTS